MIFTLMSKKWPWIHVLFELNWIISISHVFLKKKLHQIFVIFAPYFAIFMDRARKKFPLGTDPLPWCKPYWSIPLWYIIFSPLHNIRLSTVLLPNKKLHQVINLFAPYFALFMAEWEKIPFGADPLLGASWNSRQRCTPFWSLSLW